MSEWPFIYDFPLLEVPPGAEDAFVRDMKSGFQEYLRRWATLHCPESTCRHEFALNRAGSKAICRLCHLTVDDEFADSALRIATGFPLRAEGQSMET